MDLPVLLGVEGSAARIYFGLMEKAVDPKWGFTNRNRRPPKDPVNALLSFGYTLLTYSMSAALQVVGLDPYLGYYHAEGYGRPALALDLIEEFRAPVVDSLVIAMINNNQFDQEDFHQESLQTGVFLNQNERRKFVKEFSQKLESVVKTRKIGRPISYMKHFEVQARKLSAMVQGKVATYDSFELR